MYTEKVMDHFQHPRNVGEIENASGVGTVGNAKCGDIMRIYLDVDSDQINYFHFMIDLDQGPCAIKRLRGRCGYQQYGDRTGQREIRAGSHEGDKQSGDGSA